MFFFLPFICFFVFGIAFRFTSHDKLATRFMPYMEVPLPVNRATTGWLLLLLLSVLFKVSEDVY